jgi:hypothetical protein
MAVADHDAPCSKPYRPIARCQLAWSTSPAKFRCVVPSLSASQARHPLRAELGPRMAEQA